VSELARVADALGEAAAVGETSVLATVVRTEGSTYRRIGARLVARPGGVRAGAVSAGCLEGEVLARSADVLARGEPAVVAYDSRSADDLVWGFGLGCGGLVELLLEPLDPHAAAIKSARLWAIATRRWRSVLATVIRAPGHVGGVRAGDHAVIVDEQGNPFDGFETIDDLALRRALHDTARAVLRAGRSMAVHHPWTGEPFDIAYELVLPSVHLGICGAGIDAAPVVAAAKHMGWHVTLIDDRPAMARADRWPEVDRIIVADPQRLGRAVAMADCDAAIIMSHNYERDAEYLAAWVTQPTSYIGVLGPRQRTDQMLTALGLTDDATRKRIHGPVGLDIGAETAEEIALAIVAEVQAAHTGRSGGALAELDGPIHGDIRTRTPVPHGSTTTPSCVTT
jgi:xanthine dehydrogenase accessory factor